MFMLFISSITSSSQRILGLPIGDTNETAHTIHSRSSLSPLFLGVRLPERDADHSTAPSYKIKNEWIYFYVSPICSRIRTTLPFHFFPPSSLQTLYTFLVGQTFYNLSVKKRKIVSVINYAHDMKTYMGMGMEFQAFLTAVLAADNWSAVHLDIPTPNKAPRHPPQKRLGGSQSRSKYGDEEIDTYRHTELLHNFNSKDHSQCVQCAVYCCSHLRLNYCQVQMLYSTISS